MGTSAKETDQVSYPFFWYVSVRSPASVGSRQTLVPVSPCKHACCLGIRAPLGRGRHGPGQAGATITTEHSSDTLLKKANCVDCQRSGADQCHLQTAPVAPMSKETYEAVAAGACCALCSNSHPQQAGAGMPWAGGFPWLPDPSCVSLCRCSPALGC